MHDPLLPAMFSVTSDARDLVEKQSLWIAPLTTAYQLNTQEDGDPNSELPTDGATTPINGVEQSVVYIESCRDEYDYSFRLVDNGATPQIGINAIKHLKNYIVATAAHEIGHQPGVQDGDIHHAELGLMRRGGVNNKEHSEKDSFSASTILRFRNSQKWSR